MQAKAIEVLHNGGVRLQSSPESPIVLNEAALRMVVQRQMRRKVRRVPLKHNAGKPIVVR